MSRHPDPAGITRPAAHLETDALRRAEHRAMDRDPRAVEFMGDRLEFFDLVIAGVPRDIAMSFGAYLDALRMLGDDEHTIHAVIEQHRAALLDAVNRAARTAHAKAREHAARGWAP